jgi:hypothetical protein
MQRGFQKDYHSISIDDKSVGGIYSYWKSRVDLSKIVCDWEAKKEADLAHKRLIKARIERLQMIKELVEL